ncbi:uncharacterized protein LOC144118880 [Amblyomma americanum]
MGTYSCSTADKESPNADVRGLEFQRRECSSNRTACEGSAMAGPDERLSWAIAVICFVINFISACFNRCAGMFFNSIMDTFRASRGDASVPASVYAGFYCFSGLVAGALIQSFGIRLTVIMGGIMMCIGCSVSIFATSTLFLVISVGVVTGTGHGIANSCCIVAVTRYFDKFRGIALGLNLAGPPMTSLVIPKLLEWLLAEYGLRGTFLLVGACLANVPVLGILLHKPPWEKAALAQAKNAGAGRTSVVDSNNKAIRHSTCDPSSVLGKRRSTASSITNYRRTTPISLERVPEVTEGATTSNLVTTGRNFSLREETPRSHHRSSVASRRSTFDSTAGGMTLSDTSSIVATTPAKMSAMERRGTLMSVAGSMFATRKVSAGEGDAFSRRGTVASVHTPGYLQTLPLSEDMQQVHVKGKTADAPTSALSSLKEVLCEPRMYFHTLSFFSCAFFMDSYLTVMFDLGEDIGVPVSDSVLALTLSSAMDVVGRFFVPFLTDYGVTSTSSLLTFFYVMLAVISALMPLVSENIAFVALCAILGIPGGYIVVGTSEILSTELGTKNLPMAYGLMTFVCATGSFARPPVVGFFRDKLGSYDGLFLMMGGMLLLSFIFNVGLWIASRCSRSKDTPTAVQNSGPVSVSGALSTIDEEKQITSL